MAMNKKELAELDALRMEVRVAKAFRLGSPVARDLPPPTGSLALTRGWNFNWHSKAVFMACSDVISNGEGWEKTTSQNPRHLFSTELVALKALRYEVAYRAARELADIDARIEAQP